MTSRLPFIALICMILCACSLTDNMKLKEPLDQQQQKAEQLSGEIMKPHPHFEIKSGNIYLDGEDAPLRAESQLPSFFQDNFRLVENIYLPGIADRVSKRFRISVSVASEVKLSALESAMPVRFEGPLKLFLDSVASYYGLYWKYQDGGIQFYRTETRTFTLLATMEKIKTSNVISNTQSAEGGGDSDSGSSGESSQITSSEISFSAWEEAVTNIKEMLSSEGHVTANKSTGTVTVTDIPGIIHRVATYIHQIERKQVRQVAIDVQVVNFEVTNTRNRAFNADFVFQDINGAAVKLLSGSATSGATGSGSIAAAILEDGASNDSLRAFYGSQLVLNALREKGRTSAITSGSGIVLNNMPLPIQKLHQEGYLASISSTLSDSGNTTTSTMESATISTGFSMVVVPHILDDNRILLNYSLTLSELDNLKEYTSGGQTIYTPEVSSQSFSNRLIVRSGSTVVLAGYAHKSLEDTDKTGLFSISNAEENNQELIVIMIDVNDVTIS